MPKYETRSPVMSGGKIHPIGSTVELSERDGRDLEALGAVRRLAGSPAKEKVETGGGRKTASGPLPDDFPGREPLAEAGITTFEQLLEMTPPAVGEVKGIGPATLRSIGAALDSLQG